jgi:hypothetical protein
MTQPIEPTQPAEPDEPAGFREVYRKQLLTGLGGWSGTVIAAIPTVVFVVVNTVARLHWAIVAAVGSAILLAGYRLLRRQSVQQAVSGLLGVLIAALIAARTGQAKGYFLFGIITSFAYADDGNAEQSLPWYQRPVLRRAYDLATALAAAIFLARGIVQLALFRENSTGWLAVARIAMGYPLYIVAVGFGLWSVNRARRSIDD